MRLSDIVAHSGLSRYAEIALILFLVVFVAIVIRVFTARRAEMDRHARLPLEDGDRPAKESRHD